MLRKGVYPCEYMNDWEKFNEKKLPKEEEFYSNLNLEDIPDADHMHGERFCKDFKQNILVNIMIFILRVMYYF